MSEQKSFIGILIDSPNKEAEEILKKRTFQELVNIKKSLEMAYERARLTKDELIKGIDSNKFVDKQKAENTVQDLYKVMQKIEDKATIVETLRKEKGVKSKSKK